MNLTSKSRYAFKIMIDLANRKKDSLVERSDIVAIHGIPPSYLDHILLRLKNGGLISSRRGRRGGYVLLKNPNDISVFEIVKAVEDSVEPVQCLVSPELCQHEDVCVSKGAWQLVFDSLKASLSNISLSRLVAAENQTLRSLASGIEEQSHSAVQECRSATLKATSSRQESQKGISLQPLETST